MKRPENQYHLLPLDTKMERAPGLLMERVPEITKWSAFPAEAATLMAKESGVVRCLCL